MRGKTGVNVVNVVTMYAFNVNGVEFARDMYSEEYKGSAYAQEKFKLMQRSFVSFWGQLDAGNRARFVEISFAKYGEEALGFPPGDL